MRKILFRGKRKTNGKWIYGDYFRSKISNTELGGRVIHSITFFQNGEEFSYTIDPNTLGQFTGLTDKNGKKIFEGDILSIAQKSNGLGDYFYPSIKYPANVIVKWDKCCWMWEVIAKQKYYLTFPDAWCHYECEVIGNATDNPKMLPELLEDKS